MQNLSYIYMGRKTILCNSIQTPHKQIDYSLDGILTSLVPRHIPLKSHLILGRSGYEANSDYINTNKNPRS